MVPDQSPKDSAGHTGSMAEAAEWLDVHDLAARFQSSVRHIYRLADTGGMPWGVKLGQLRRWSRREIEAWERNGCRPVRDGRGRAT